MRARDRWRRLVALLALVGLLATGCAAIPDSGPVEAGPPIEAGDETEQQFIPNGPTEGADQEAVLRGFVAAATGSQDDYATAREFLTDDAAAQWDPRASVLILDPASPVVSRVDEAALQYTVRVAADVDASGVYSESETAESTSLYYRFTQVDGEWRIAEPPSGIVLAGSSFLSLFTPRTLYFFAPGYEYLVPDVRWFPQRDGGGSGSTRVVSELLAGPAAWLRGAVLSAFPEGTSLSPVNAVTQTEGVATVDLSTEALAASTGQLARMRQQLAASLSRSSPGISQVAITVDQQPVTISDEGVEAAVLAPSAADTRSLVRTADALGFSAAGEITDLPGLSAEAIELAATSFTLGRSQAAAAALTPGGTAVLRRDGPPLLVDVRPGQVAPDLDPSGYVWTGTAQDAQIAVHDQQGTGYPLTTSIPAGLRLTDLEVSRDGTRLLLLVDDGGDPRLLAAGILRDDGAPTGIGSPIEVQLDAQVAIGATWVDDTNVAVLAESDGEIVATSHQIGGRAEPLGRPGDAVQIMGAGDRDRLRVLGADGTVLQPRGAGTGWRSGAEGVVFLGRQL
ncbi:LpqB family beta-propeller domain-containing protein [Arenivirga flava]|uniref:Lipoprotein LpqB n=1 Tax=Arenivirga flava TaxID=1930060 RepID=A0AA37UH48_9MICO|nr:LpqB family beta-propeller domain-containing protein [Arenivirga flava]GMA27971.1 lipoprotein LpqB [Arenivirga flava]